MIVNKKCAKCGKEFEYDEKPGFPRKYCFSCGAENKASYERTQNPAPVVKPGEPKSLNPGVIAPGAVYPKSNTTMYVSYAKDIFCGILEKGNLTEKGDGREAMQLAIELVKQAKEAFE